MGWALRMPGQHAVLLRGHCTGGFAALTSLPVLLPGTSACQTGYLSGSYLARTRSIALRLRASEWAVLFPFVAWPDAYMYLVSMCGLRPRHE